MPYALEWTRYDGQRWYWNAEEGDWKNRVEAATLYASEHNDYLRNSNHARWVPVADDDAASEHFRPASNFVIVNGVMREVHPQVDVSTLPPSTLPPIAATIMPLSSEEARQQALANLFLLAQHDPTDSNRYALSRNGLYWISTTESQRPESGYWGSFSQATVFNTQSATNFTNSRCISDWVGAFWQVVEDRSLSQLRSTPQTAPNPYHQLFNEAVAASETPIAADSVAAVAQELQRLGFGLQDWASERQGHNEAFLGQSFAEEHGAELLELAERLIAAVAVHAYEDHTRKQAERENPDPKHRWIELGPAPTEE